MDGEMDDDGARWCLASPLSLTIMPDQQQQGHRVIEKAEVRMMMMVVIADGERG